MIAQPWIGQFASRGRERYDSAMDQKKKNIVLVLGLALLLGGGYYANREKTSPLATSPSGINGSNGATPAGVPLVDPESVNKVIKDAKTGREYVSNQIIVEFQPGISEQASLGIIDEVGGKMLQRFTIAPLFLVQVKDAGDGKGATKAIATLNKNASVKNADYNYLSTIKEGTAK